MWPFDDALCGNCNHATVHSGSIYMPRWGALLIVAPAPGAAVAPLQAAWTSGYQGLFEKSSIGALTWEGTKKLRCLAKVFQCHKFEPEVEFISSNSSSSIKSDSENIICHDKAFVGLLHYHTKKKKSIFDCL